VPLNTDSLITDYSPRTLRSEIQRRGRLPFDDCVALGLSLARALARLHAQGLVHRDIKPSNIIFVGGTPKLADIGLVTDAGEARSYVGTEGFIPPEGPGSPAADLYSLGKVLYEASTGKDRQDFPEPLTHLGDQPDKDRLLELNAIRHRACHSDPRARYHSAEVMLAELELLQRGESVKARRVVQRHWNLLRAAKSALMSPSAMKPLRHLARLAAGLALLAAPASLPAAFLDASGLLVSQWRNAPFIDSFLDPAAPSDATLAASVVLGNGERLDSVAVVLCPAGTHGAPGAGSLGHLRWGLWLSAPEDFAAARLADLASTNWLRFFDAPSAAIEFGGALSSGVRVGRGEIVENPEGRCLTWAKARRRLAA